MKRLFIGIGILAILSFIAYQFLFADRRSRLQVDTSKTVSYNESINATRSLERKMLQSLLERNGDVEFEVADRVVTKDALSKLVKEFNGYVSSESQNSYGGEDRSRLVVRLPSAVVDDFVLKIDSLATKIESKDISMTDVTEDFIDVESSLVTKKKLEARYQEILKQAKTVTEIMEIEVRIGTVHAEIESLEGRLNYLTNQTSFGTLTLVFHEPATSTPVALGHELVAAFRNGWSGTLQFLVLLATIWPVLIVAGITTFLYFRFTRVKVSN